MALEAMNLEEFLEMEGISEIMELTRRNHVLACILEKSGLAKVNQPYPNAEDLESSFEGSLEKMDSGFVEEQIAMVREKCGDMIEDAEMVDKLRGLLSLPWVYSRLDHPMYRLVEEVVSKMEGAEDTAVFASGLAAIEAVIMHETVAPCAGSEGEYVPGGKIVVVSNVYGGTAAQCEDACRRFGRQYVQMTLEQFGESGLPDDAGMCFFESSCNPMMDIAPFEELVAEGRRLGIKTVCDTTFAPGSIKPLKLGVDYVIHSMTKYLGGRSRHTGGCLSGRKDDVNQVRGIKTGRRMLGGAVMDFLVTRDFLEDMQDLPERLWKATRNARKVRAVAQRYGLPVHSIDDVPDYEKYRNPEWPENVTNGMLAIDFGSKEKALAFCNAMQKAGCGQIAVSLGAVEALYSRPRGTTHSELCLEQLDKMGITEGIVRMSCGIEEDLAEKFEMVLKSLFV